MSKPVGTEIDVDLDKLAERGANLCGEDHFFVRSCSLCQGQYLYNREVNDVYFDPDDLGRHFFDIEGLPLPPCRYCGNINWSFSSQPPDLLAIQAGVWGWVLKRHSFTFGADED